MLVVRVQRRKKLYVSRCKKEYPKEPNFKLKTSWKCGSGVNQNTGVARDGRSQQTGSKASPN